MKLVRTIRRDIDGGLFVELACNGKQYEAYMPHFFAQQHAEDMLQEITDAHARGIPVQEALDAVRMLELPRGAFRKFSGMHNSVIFEEDADMVPEQLIRSLKSFASVSSNAPRKILVLGDLENLADSAIEVHTELGMHAAEVADMLLFVGDLMRHARTSALKTDKRIDTHHFTTSPEVTRWLPEHVKAGDHIFIVGGKHMDMQQIVERLTQIE